MQGIFCVRSSFFLFPLLIASLSSGCRSCEVVETALRMREQDLLMMREELLQKEFQIQALQRELYDMRRHSPSAALRMPTEIAAQIYPLRRITLGRSTSGYDDDRQPGDEALQVVIEPRDVNDDIIKSPGTAVITALENSPEGLKTPIGSWTITPSELAPKWKQGLFTTGYVLVLPWQKTPQHEQVRIILRFQTLDGRLFEADKDIRLRLPPHMPRTTNGVPLPSAEEPLPPPAPIEPGDLNNGKKPPADPKNQKDGVPFPQPSDGPVLQPVNSHWRAPTLEGAFRLKRPVPLEPKELPEPPF